MKVKIGPYTNYFGPYQLAEALCFWAKPVKDEYGFYNKPDWVHKFGEWLAHGSIERETAVGEVRSISREYNKTLLYKLLLWIDSKKHRKISIRIDAWDVYDASESLALIILPILEKIDKNKQGAPYVDNEDVPEHLRSTEVDKNGIDKNHFARWEYVLNEMIFAFRNKVQGNWESQFYSGEVEWQFKKVEGEYSELTHGSNHTFKVDREGKAQYYARIKNGYRLFGKYYDALWS